MKKICKKCNKSFIPEKGKSSPFCSDKCRRGNRKMTMSIYYKEWVKKNRDKVRRNDRNWRERNKERIKEHRKEYLRNYYQKNKKEINRHHQQRLKERCKNDPMFKMNRQISREIRRSLKKSKKASRHWENLVGYTTQDLMDRLSVNFQEGMSFENYGEWHIDHKKPQSAFNFETPDDPEFKLCWSLSNLQPLWAEENIIKSNNFPYFPHQPRIQNN